MDGNRVELSSATVAFTKGVLGFLADGLSVNTPQLQPVFMNCIGDLFENQVVLFEAILKSGRYANQHEFILKNASFVLETILPHIKKRLKYAYTSRRLIPSGRGKVHKTWHLRRDRHSEERQLGPASKYNYVLNFDRQEDGGNPSKCGRKNSCN
ncbi:Exocyst complex component 8 [Desmophyllum pertusum]|uniref:Exocyst complex component 8 n=1 Tax=Desmophyllum pertusum TaxID=174260 RepID=A0A9X0CKL4_9CNID|nr:Exocyst complex component 8 [Desmophyllum pertusum]